MANLTQVELPDGTTYDIQDAQKSGVYTVIGTQTASTNAFTGTIPINALYDGLTINYYIPYAPTSSSATLNLTLADGTTTGAKNLYITTSRFTSHIGAGRNIVMTYWSAGSISISGTPTTDDRWVCDGYYDQNDVVTLRSQYPRITAGGNGIKRNSLFSRILDGTYSSFFSGNGGTAVNKTYDLTTYFDPTTIWYHQNSDDIAVGAVTANNTVDFQHSLCDLRYSFSGITSSASTSTLEANKPVYIVFDKASESNGYYRLREPVWTQTPSDWRALYVLVAYAYDVYRCDLWVNNPIFTYDNTSQALVSANFGAVRQSTDFPTDYGDDYPILFSSDYSSTSIGKAYKSSQLTFDPVDNELTFRQVKTSDSYGREPNFRLQVYNGNSREEILSLGDWSTFYRTVTFSSDVEFDENSSITFYEGSYVTFQGELSLFEGSITGEGNINIDGDITCTGALSADTLNGETIGNSPKFTDTIGQIYYCETDSTSTTSAFVVTISGITELTDGLTLCIKNTKGTSVSGCTLNVNSLGAKSIWLSQDNVACTTEWKNNSTFLFIFDATNDRWVIYQGTNVDINANNVVSRYSRLVAGGNGVKKYSLFAMLPDGTYSSFTTNSGSGSKTFDTTHYFDIRKIFAYVLSSDRSSGAALSATSWEHQGFDIDMRYSFSGVTTSASTSSLVLDKPVYLVFDPSAGSDGCYKIKSPYYTQTPNATGAIYVLVGVMRDSYRLDFWLYNPAFTYDGTKLVPFANSTLSGLVDTSITNPSAGDILTYDGFDWYNTNTIALKDSNGHTEILLDGNTGTITSENTPSTGGFTVNDVVIGGFTTGSGQWFKFSLPFSNTATSAAILSLDQASSKLMLPSAVLQTNFIDLSNSVVSSITKDWITFEFKLNSTQAANTPGTILLASFEFELY